jgi:ribonucleoside-triphosphate reductase
MVVIKRDGREADFDKGKIANAILKAFTEVEKLSAVGDKNEVPKKISTRLYNRYQRRNRAISVEEIQDDVETELMKEGEFVVAKAYIKYRYEHELLRNASSLDGKILSIADNVNETVIQENSNKNPTILSTQRDYIAGEVSRDITDRLLMPDDIKQAHEEGVIHFHDSDYFVQHMMNCFSSKTRFVTKDGVVSFAECHDGDKVTVLDKDGCWRDATVHKYGVQKLYDVTFQSARSERTVTCTRDHRWILADGTVTTELSVGDKLYPLHDNSKFDVPEDTRAARMFALGFVIGDGNDIGNGLSIRLCGEKVQYQNVFESAGFVASFHHPNGDLVMISNSGLSKQDFLNYSIWKYLSPDDKRMLFYGLYAADGSKDRHQISTSDTRVLAMVEDISAIAGYHVASISVIEHDTNFKQGAILYCVNFRLKQNPNNLWKVSDIKEHRRGNALQDVWCVEEPETHSFTLDGGIVTGNCCLINLEDMLQNGTVISGTLIEKPHSFSTACNVATQIIAQVASNQYGGQSISLSHLAPFVEVSRQKIRKQVEAEFLKISSPDNFADPEKVISDLVEERVREEVKKGVQTIQYQVITLMTTNGQAPFITVFMYLNEVSDPQTKKDLAMIIEEVVRQRYQGVKNEKGVWTTPAFPKLIYVLEEDNITEDSPYWYLTQLCAKCSAKRLVPDYISEKKMREYKLSKGETEGNGDCYTCMGCRSFLTPDRSGNGWDNVANAGNYQPDKPKYYGRFNQGVVTINLPDVALSALKVWEATGDHNDIQNLYDTFWEIFDERLELCHKALQIRHERLSGTLSDASPIHWQYGALARLKKGETIDKLLHGGYSTISLGYAGLYECVMAMTGKSHTDPDGEPFALKVMQYMNDKCAAWKAAEDIDYSLYGTPIESTTYKFAKCLQKRFGVIEGITDKGYITNSYHVHVTEHINAFDKLRFESQFQKLSPGGAISYIEVANLSDNIPAVLTVLKYIYDNIMYAELNTKSDYCQVCGWDKEIEIVDDDRGKLIWKCPNCGNTDKSKMNIARRTCGYIGLNDWNQGRTQEIKERYVHLGGDE